MGRYRGVKTYVSSVDEFLKASPWIGPADRPAVTTLQQLASQLDDQGRAAQAALVAQFGLVYRNLLKRAPGADGDPEEDELENLLGEARAGSAR